LEACATLPPRGISYSIGRKTGGVMGKTGDVMGRTGGVRVCVALATLCSESRGFQPTVIEKDKFAVAQRRFFSRGIEPALRDGSETNPVSVG
jgi:hypothetical protein